MFCVDKLQLHYRRRHEKESIGTAQEFDQEMKFTEVLEEKVKPTKNSHCKGQQTWKKYWKQDINKRRTAKRYSKETDMHDGGYSLPSSVTCISVLRPSPQNIFVYTSKLYQK